MFDVQGLHWSNGAWGPVRDGNGDGDGLPSSELSRMDHLDLFPRRRRSWGGRECIEAGHAGGTY